MWWLRGSITLLLTALLVVSAGFVGQRLMIGLLARENAALRSQHDADIQRIRNLEQRATPTEARAQALAPEAPRR
jgi:hypothetical protein